MKKIFIVLWLLLFISISNAWENKFFTIESVWPYQNWNEIKLSLKNTIPSNIKDIKLFIWNQQLLRLWNSGYPNYLFQIKSKLSPDNRSIKISIDYQNGKHDDFVYPDVKIPYFSEIDVINPVWWAKARIYFSASSGESCTLFAWGKDWSIEGSNDNYYINIPVKIPTAITWWYLVCDGLNSNFVKFYVPESPSLIYAISKNKKPIIPGSTLIVKWKNIKLLPTDKVEVYLWSKIIPAKFIDNNTFEITLPSDKNISTSLKVVRNGFESNTLSIKANKVPVIYNVSTSNWDNWGYFEIYGNFDFSLWAPIVSYNWHNLKVVSYRKISPTIWYIRATYPIASKNWNDFSCSMNIVPWKISVTIWWVKSNDFYYNPDITTYIVKYDYPKCNNWTCEYRFYTNTNLPNNVHVLLNWNLIQNALINWNVIYFTQDQLIKKWYIQLQFPDCKLTNKVYFDFTQHFLPKIEYITSEHHFVPDSKFQIDGKYIASDWIHDSSMWINLKLEPNVLLKNKFMVSYVSIIWNISALAKDGEVVKVSLSNVNGKANDGYFVINGDKRYLWAPIIDNVTYLNWWFAWDDVTIVWYNFSDNCSDNVIYLDNKAIYPYNCSFNELTFKIPQGLLFQNVKVVRQDEKISLPSNSFKLNTNLWWVKSYNNLKLLTFWEIKYININKSNQISLPFKIYNPLADIFVPEFKILISLSGETIPIDQAKLLINWESNQYTLLDNKLVKQDTENNGIIEKTLHWTYLVFRNIYIPFSANPIDAEIQLTLSKSVPNWTHIKLYTPSSFYYYKVFDPVVAKLFKSKNQLIWDISISNPSNVCIDTDPTNKNCALALLQKKTNISYKNTSKPRYITYKKPATSYNKPKSLTRKEKIARKLNLQKMNLLNKVIKEFIIKMKNKYWWNKEKMKYILQMYKWYKIMLANTSDDLNSKIKYVDWLIYFAKNYFAFIKSK